MFLNFNVLKINKFGFKSHHTIGDGFSMVEIVIVIAIFTVLIFGSAIMINDIFNNSAYQMQALTSIDQTRATLVSFKNEIRNAVTGNDGSYPLNQAGDLQIVFFSNFGLTNSIVKRIRYFFDDGILYKGVVVPTGNPLVYNLSTETITPIVSAVVSDTSKIFYYYDGDYEGMSDAISQPVNVNNVKFVKIVLEISNQLTSNSINRFSSEAGTTIRSLKDNLGN